MSQLNGLQSGLGGACADAEMASRKARKMIENSFRKSKLLEFRIANERAIMALRRGVRANREVTKGQAERRKMRCGGCKNAGKKHNRLWARGG